MSELAERERWPRERIEAHQLACINAIWANAAQHVPYYRNLKEAQSLPDRFDDLHAFRERMPILTKATLREAGAAAFMSEVAPPGRWMRTGGSTGHPMSIFWSHDDYRLALRARCRFYATCGAEIFERTVFLWGGEINAAQTASARVRRLRQWSTDRLRNRLRLSAYQVESVQLREHLRKIAAFRPAMLYGYGQAIHLLAREAGKAGFRCPSLRLIVVTSEVVTPSQIQEIEEALGAKVAIEYGAAECPLIAGRAPGETWLRVREDIALVETVPAGDAGHQIVLTPLANRSFPLLRYAMGDFVREAIRQPAEGFSQLGTIGGRSDDIFLDGKGEPVHPTKIDAVFEHEPGVRRYRVHQASDGAVSAWLELDAPLPLGRLGELERDLAAVVGRPTTVEVVERIALTRGGKHRTITSSLARHLSAALMHAAAAKLLSGMGR